MNRDLNNIKVRIFLMLIAALTIVSGFVFYVKKYVHPQVGRVSLFDAVFTKNSDLKSESDSNFNSKLDLSSKNIDFLNEHKTDETRSRGDGATSTGVSVNTQMVGTSTAVSASTTTRSFTATSTTMSTTTKPRIESLEVPYMSKELGVSFMVDSLWGVSSQKNSPSAIQSGMSNVNVYIKTATSTHSGVSTIVVQRFKGSSVSVEDKKYGNVTYFYDTLEKTWMRIAYTDAVDSRTTLYPEAFLPIQFTKNRKPIFEGNDNGNTLIVALDTNDFIIAHMSEGGSFKTFNTFIKNISI